MSTETEKYTEYVAKARKEVVKNFRTLMHVCDEYAMAQKAKVANDQSYGYTAPYGEKNYVPYNERSKDWLAVEHLVNAVFDTNSDVYSDAEVSFTTALASLEHTEKKRLTDLLTELFNGSDSLA